MKKYISVTAQFDQDGNILPLKINWDDGRTFDIDRVTDIRYAASLKAGGAGIRYTCRIHSKEKYIYLEENRWFIEEPNIVAQKLRSTTPERCS
ncbi:MAG: hypothetical protein KBS62_04410 [Oscillospiraceae bacterium]|nr:hypothetical protein [Candidatus Ruminococcus equi]